VPVLRYFLVMGCCLLGLLFAADYFLPQTTDSLPPADSASSGRGGSLASWRASQDRKDKPLATAVVYPDIATLPATPERLQWERQMTFRRDAPAQEAKSTSVYEARAEMADVTAAAKVPAKPAVKMASRPKTVARADRHDRPNYAAAYPPAPAAQVGGYRQAQFDRPAAGGFFNFRMF
jgi:hypothetical protein